MAKRNSKRRVSQVQPSLLNLPASKLPPDHTKLDFRSSMHWRIFRIVAEFIDGFQYIADFKKCVTFFGSARFLPGDKWYTEARKLARILAKNGFSVVTGGGPGVMEAANRGAWESKGESIGINIQLPREERSNPYVEHSIGFHYFFTRKLMLTYSAEAYVYFPGGFGTLDEFFEIVTLIQTKKIEPHIPVVLVGREYWGPFTEWIDRELARKWKTIERRDTKIYEVVDSAEAAFRIIKKRAKRRKKF